MCGTTYDSPETRTDTLETKAFLDILQKDIKV